MQFDEFFFCYKDIRRKAFFTMATLLMLLLENVDSQTKIFLILYPPFENSITRTAIILVFGKGSKKEKPINEVAKVDQTLV